MSLGWDQSPTASPGGVESLGWDQSETLGRGGGEKGGTRVKEEKSVSSWECRVRLQAVLCTKVHGEDSTDALKSSQHSACQAVRPGSGYAHLKKDRRLI